MTRASASSGYNPSVASEFFRSKNKHALNLNEVTKFKTKELLDIVRRLTVIDRTFTLFVHAIKTNGSHCRQRV